MTPLYINSHQFYTPWQAEEEEDDTTDQEGEEEGSESVATIDSIAYMRTLTRQKIQLHLKTII